MSKRPGVHPPLLKRGHFSLKEFLERHDVLSQKNVSERGWGGGKVCAKDAFAQNFRVSELLTLSWLENTCYILSSNM